MIEKAFLVLSLEAVDVWCLYIVKPLPDNRVNFHKYLYEVKDKDYLEYIKGREEIRQGRLSTYSIYHIDKRLWLEVLIKQQMYEEVFNEACEDLGLIINKPKNRTGTI